MIVKGSGAYADSISQRVVTGFDVEPMSSRPSSGISIREPELGDRMVTGANQRSLLAVSVTGKGKRMVDDMRVYAAEGSYTTGVAALSTFLSNPAIENVFPLSFVGDVTYDSSDNCSWLGLLRLDGRIIHLLWLGLLRLPLRKLRVCPLEWLRRLTVLAIITSEELLSMIN